MPSTDHAHRQILGKTRVGRLVFDQHQARREATSLGHTDQRVRRNGFKTGGQVRANVALDALRQLLGLHDGQVGQRNRTGHRVPAVGVAMVEFAPLLDQHLGDPVAHHDAAQRDVAAGDCLGKRHQIGLVAKFFIRKPVTQAAKGANDLVADQQNAVFVHNALNFGPVGGRWNDDTARPLNRLGNERGNFVGTQRQNLFFEPASGTQSKCIGRFSRQTVLKEVRLLNVGDVRNGQITLRVHAAHAAQRGPGHGAAVVGVFAADDDLALRLAQQIPITTHHAHVGIIALAAAARKKHMLKAAVTHRGCQ